MIDLLLALCAGIVVGIVTGITPGLHINLIAAILPQVFFLFNNGLSIGVFIFSVAITHTFLDVIPATLLGAPNPDTAECILPAQQMVLEGRGYEAIVLSTMGAQGGTVISVLLFPFLVLVLPYLEYLLTPIVGFILLGVSIFFILSEEDNNKRFWAFTLFLLAGVLGCLVLSFPNLNQPLLPLLSGLFGISTLVFSLKEKPVIVPQTTRVFFSCSARDYVRVLGASSCAAVIAAFLPGLGTSQAAMASKALLPKNDSYSFMIAQGGINSMNYLFSLATWWTLNKARNGAVVTLKDVLEPSGNTIALLVTVGLVVGAIATILTLGISRLVIRWLERVDYQFVGKAIMGFVVILTGFVSGWQGLAVLVISTFLGLLPHLLGVRKSILMGCLVIPVIFFLV